MNLLVKCTQINEFNKPLIEKYRPKKFDDIIFNKFLSKKFNTLIKGETLPDMILTGEPSTGKTSTALFLANKLFNENNILELNASDDRGLTVIMNTIQPFCKKKTIEQKLIILDEADSITTKAQQILANLMDEYKNKVKFIYICNEHHKINEVIQTRCIIINFPKLVKKNLVKKLIDICKKEDVNYTNEGIEKLCFYSSYDIRQCLNNIECIKYNGNIINNEIVNNIIDKPKIELIKNIFELINNKKLHIIINEINKIYEMGYNLSDILLIFLKYIENFDNSEYLKHNNNLNIEIFNITSKYYILINNLNSKLQLCAYIIKIYKVINSNS